MQLPPPPRSFYLDQSTMVNESEEDTILVPSSSGRKMIPKLRMFEATCRVKNIISDEAKFVELLAVQDNELKEQVEKYFNRSDAEESSYNKVKEYLMDYRSRSIHEHVQARIDTANLKTSNLTDLVKLESRR